MHILVYPTDGLCQCDGFRNYVQPQDGTFKCHCYQHFLTKNGRCTNCEYAFPGCTACSKVGEVGDNYTSGIEVIYNPNMPKQVPGIYKCFGCSSNTEYFD